jgi:hypothetical protein
MTRQQKSPRWWRTFPKECKSDWLEFEQVFGKKVIAVDDDVMLTHRFKIERVL